MYDMVSDLIFVWPLDGDQVFCIDSKTNKHKKEQQKKWKFSAGHSNRWHFLSTVSRSNWNISFFIKRSKHRFLDPDSEGVQLQTRLTEFLNELKYSDNATTEH